MHCSASRRHRRLAEPWVECTAQRVGGTADLLSQISENSSHLVNPECLSQRSKFCSTCWCGGVWNACTSESAAPPTCRGSAFSCILTCRCRGSQNPCPCESKVHSNPLPLRVSGAADLLVRVLGDPLHQRVKICIFRMSDPACLLEYSITNFYKILRKIRLTLLIMILMPMTAFMVVFLTILVVKSLSPHRFVFIHVVSSCFLT